MSFSVSAIVNVIRLWQQTTTLVTNDASICGCFSGHVGTSGCERKLSLNRHTRKQLRD